MKRPAPFLALAVPLVQIVATAIARGWRYAVAPQGRGKVTAYTLLRARQTARRYSKRVLEIGPRAAFPRQRRAPD
jgi:hypothetical protein